MTRELRKHLSWIARLYSRWTGWNDSNRRKETAGKKRRVELQRPSPVEESARGTRRGRAKRGSLRSLAHRFRVRGAKFCPVFWCPGFPCYGSSLPRSASSCGRIRPGGSIGASIGSSSRYRVDLYCRSWKLSDQEERLDGENGVTGNYVRSYDDATGRAEIIAINLRAAISRQFQKCDRETETAETPSFGGWISGIFERRARFS